MRIRCVDSEMFWVSGGSFLPWTPVLWISDEIHQRSPIWTSWHDDEPAPWLKRKRIGCIGCIGSCQVCLPTCKTYRLSGTEALDSWLADNFESITTWIPEVDRGWSWPLRNSPKLPTRSTSAHSFGKSLSAKCALQTPRDGKFFFEETGLSWRLRLGQLHQG